MTADATSTVKGPPLFSLFPTLAFSFLFFGVEVLFPAVVALLLSLNVPDSRVIADGLHELKWVHVFYSANSAVFLRGFFFVSLVQSSNKCQDDDDHDDDDGFFQSSNHGSLTLPGAQVSQETSSESASHALGLYSRLSPTRSLGHSEGILVLRIPVRKAPNDWTPTSTCP